MCVLAFAIRTNAHWPLVLLANRDERHDRLSAPLHRWSEPAGIVAGRDLSGGGTWLGVNDHGRLAAITNVRAPAGPQEGRPTRGGLVQGLLLDEPDLSLATLEAYNLFNLLQLDLSGATVWTNAPEPQRIALGPGVHSLSNSQLQEKTPRALRLEKGLAHGLAGNADDGALLDLLIDDEPIDGAPPIFMRNPVYGTRCSTLVRVAADGAARVTERRFDPTGAVTGETVEPFRWPGALRAGVSDR